MATDTEIHTTLRAWLYDTMKIKKQNGTLDDLIEKYKATMDAEDFAYVEKIINGDKGETL